VPAGTTTFPTVVGMEIDAQNRLWVAGGRTGKFWVVDATDGRVMKEVTVPSVGTSLLNDVAIVGGAAYITDTFVPTLWRLSAEGGAVGEIEPWLDLQGTAIPYGEGASLNGITATPDGGRLLVVHMGQGRLFTIDLASKAIAEVDLGGADLSGADGLVLDGETLYVVRQTAVEIATVRLSLDFTRGEVVSRFTDPSLAWPATAVRVDEDLVVVNTQFNTRRDDSTTRPFTLLRVPVARLQPQ
jgi:Cu-Zn family superoxide dismutase